MLAGFTELFKWMYLPEDVQRALMATSLIKGGTTVLEGLVGTGKTTTIETFCKIFGLSMGKVTCAPQKVTLEGTFFRLKLPELINEGIEVINWKEIMDSDVIFISEINRAPQSFQDELIDLLQYKEMEAYGSIKILKKYTLTYLDMNPYRGGLDKAIGDRPVATINFPRPKFTQRWNISQMRLDGQSIRDVRGIVEQKANFDDLIICQDEVEKIKINKIALIIATLITESFSTCLFKKDSASDRWQPPCLSDKLNDLYDTPKNVSFKCTFHGEICSCVASPMAYRIDESLLLVAKSLAFLDGEDEVNQNHMTEALKYVVGNRLELRDEIAQKYVNSSTWVSEKLYPSLNDKKLAQWTQAINIYLKISQKKYVGEQEKSRLQGKLAAFASKNLELRELAIAVGIADFDKLDQLNVENV